MSHIGRTIKMARMVQDGIGIAQREAADRLGITAVHLCNVESGISRPSEDLIERCEEVFGIASLHVLDWCLYGDMSKLPKSVQGPAMRLTKAWKAELELP